MPNKRLKLKYDAVLPRVEVGRKYKLVVIAIEGEKREKQYFENFGSERVVVDMLPTTGGLSAPEHIIARLKNYKIAQDLQDEDTCWLVFDVDDRGETTLTELCSQAATEHFHVAISNPCFEFWLFLHRFDAEELDPRVSAAAPPNRPHELKQNLKYNYMKLAYKDFRADVDLAVQRARRIDAGTRTVVPRYPGTHVYKVVESLPIKSDRR